MVGETEGERKEGENVSLLFNDFGSGLSSRVARLGVDEDEQRVLAVRMSSLKRGNVLVGVKRHHTIVVIGGRQKRRRVVRSGVDVVHGRVLAQVLIVLSIVSTSVVSDPGVTDRVAMEIEHVHLLSMHGDRTMPIQKSKCREHQTIGVC